MCEILNSADWLRVSKMSNGNKFAKSKKVILNPKVFSFNDKSDEKRWFSLENKIEIASRAWQGRQKSPNQQFKSSLGRLIKKRSAIG